MIFSNQSLSFMCGKVLSRAMIVIAFCPFLFARLAVAQEKIKVVVTLPDLAEATQIIGGELVEVESLLLGTEDAHFVDASPLFIRKAANADVVCFMGLELEIGWLPKVLEKTGKRQIQPGGRGYCEAGKTVTVIEKPTTTIDRSHGDVHPFGNPHFNLDPLALADAGRTIAATLSQVKPEFASVFSQGLKKFQKQMQQLHLEIGKKLATLLPTAAKKPIIIEYHKEFSYFFAAYNIRSFGSIEEFPGVPPSALRMAEISQAARSASLKLAIGAYYSPLKSLQRFTEISQVPSVKLPGMVQVNDRSLNSIAKLQHHIADKIVSLSL